MKSSFIIASAVMVLACVQSVQAQEVLERFPVELSTCTGGIGVSAYFDEDSGSGYKDYQCGTTSYNGHKGTDFAPWGDTKYSCSVVAAAPGKVLSTKDGLTDDRSSSGDTNPDCSNGNSYGNHVKILQNDGSVVVYAHMKKGSIKVAQNDMVTCGQAIGVAQSSGCSTGIHLHFDIAPSTNESRFDPYKGDCGASTSRWVSQGDYKGLPAETCQCVPNCEGKTCGDDGCGGTCGECQSNETCTEHVCKCVQNCEGKTCGDDGCGGVCGECQLNETCTDHACVCVPDCEEKTCGDDGCGGTCGECAKGEKCQDHACVCVPNCEGKKCGDDGCGGTCGICSDCTEDEAAVCDGNRIKSCQNGEYIYQACGDEEVCFESQCVDKMDPAVLKGQTSQVNLDGGSCSAALFNRSGNLAFILCVFLSGLIFYRRRKSN